ncbi:MAG: thymidine phosphorylase [Chloroflexota bacterium]|nr:MAG: thymidine phosphorylase [Chloroflexota bacterium]
MDPLVTIARKRDGHAISSDEIHAFVDGYVRGTIADYQASAWLMAICCRGMTADETAALTDAMARSGAMIDLGASRASAVDKHSTGGVGDKTTLVVAPILAAMGMIVPKMSGRGLGFTGGTLDKLESIPGFTVALDRDRFLSQAHRVGLAVAGQSADLAPADGALYALRDVTATVESIPLIASSIMSKKIAVGSPAICLDVKVGRGAFMKDMPSARDLATAMVDIGRRLDRRVTAVITAMDQPLGQAVGNALEVVEAIRALVGQGPPDLMEVVVVLAGECARLVRGTSDDMAARQEALATIKSGAAFDRFRAMVAEQGGDVACIDDPGRLPRTELFAELPSPRTGYVAAIDAEAIARCALSLGAGRRKKGDPIDHAVGIVVYAKVGDRIEAGEPLLVVHCRTREQLAQIGDPLLAAYTWSDTPVDVPLLIREVIRSAPPSR